jgi:hypothetical protein
VLDEELVCYIGFTGEIDDLIDDGLKNGNDLGKSGGDTANFANPGMLGRGRRLHLPFYASHG